MPSKAQIKAREAFVKKYAKKKKGSKSTKKKAKSKVRVAKSKVKKLKTDKFWALVDEGQIMVGGVGTDDGVYIKKQAGGWTWYI